MTARWTGAAPRYFGSSDAWTLIMPRRGIAQQRVRQNPAVRGDDAEVGVEARRPREKCVLAQLGRLQNRNTRSTARLLGRRRRDVWPRPRGRSGCETTPTTVWRDSISARRVGTAKAGVPKNTMRSGRALPSPGALQLLNLADDEVALDPAQAIDEQRAVEVIHLVLKGARQQFASFDGAVRCPSGRGRGRPRAPGAPPSH